MAMGSEMVVGSKEVIRALDAGNAIIFASAGGESEQAIYDQSGKENESWRGIIFENGIGAVYGDQTLQTDLTIAEGLTLEIPAGTTLVVPDDVTLTNNGAIVGEGTLLGDVQGNPVSDSIDDGKFLVTLAVKPEKGGMVYGEGKYLPGENVKLTAEPKDGFHFVAWKNGETLISDEATYSMKVSEDLTLTPGNRTRIVTGERALAALSLSGKNTAAERRLALRKRFVRHATGRMVRLAHMSWSITTR